MQPDAAVVLVVPIAIDDWLWGHLLVSIASAPLFVLDDLEMLGLMAGQAARFFRYESLSEQQEALIHVAHSLGTHTVLTDLLDEICSQTRSALQVPIALVDVDDPEGNAAAYSARADLRTGFKQLMDVFPALSTDGRFPAGNPIRVIGDIRSDPGLPNRELFEALDLRTTVVADMVHEDRLLGRLKIVTTGAARRFSEEELALLQGIAAQAALAVRNAQLLAAAQKEIAEREKVEEALRSAQTSLERKVEERTAELREQSIRDPMTGVYNRRYMQEHLDAEMARAEAGGSSLGVIMVDVDDFKKFNDAFGHTAGDDLLRWAAEALQTRLRREDLICRFGGDEFILILVSATLDTATRRAPELHGELKEGLSRRGLDVTVSMGVAAYPQTGDGEKDVVTRADDALYHAKQTGKDRVVAETV
jgi:diguanylate cyclase (GGDEF)-like protein